MVFLQIIPSAAGGGITRAAEFIFEAIQRKRDRALQERQVSNSERITSLNAFTTLLPFLEEGTRLRDIDPTGQRLFSQAFDVDPEAFGDLELNRETFAGIVDDLSRQQFEAATPQERETLATVRAAQGLEPISDISEFQRLSAVTSMEGLRTIRQDPQRLNDFIARQEGLDPITIRFPDGETQTFDRVEAAQIFAAARGDAATAGVQLQSLELERRDRLVEMVQDQVRKREFEIGEPAVLRIFDIFDQGDAAINAFIADSRTTEGEKLAMNSLRGSISFGEEREFEGFPPELRRLMTVSKLVEQIQSADPEQVQDLVEQLPAALFGTFEEGFLGFGTPRFQVVPPEEVPTIGEVALGTVEEMTVEQVTEGITNLLNDPSILRKDIVARFGESVVAAIEKERVPTPAVSTPEELQQQAVVDLRNQKDTLTARLATAANPRVRTILEDQISRIDREILFESTVLPIEIKETQDGRIPAGGINPANVPGSQRAAVGRLNTLIRRKATVTSPRAQKTLNVTIDRLKREIRTAIAER